MLILKMHADNITAIFDTTIAKKKQQFSERKRSSLSQDIHPFNESSQLIERKIRFLKLQLKTLLHVLLYSDEGHTYWSQLYHATMLITSRTRQVFAAERAITEFERKENGLMEVHNPGDAFFLNVQALFNVAPSAAVETIEALGFLKSEDIQRQLEINTERLVARIQVYKEMQSKENLEEEEKEQQTTIISTMQSEIIALKLTIDMLQAQKSVATANALMPDWDSIYSTKLEELSGYFISGYQTILKARDAIFHEGEEIILDDDKRSELLQKHEKIIETAEKPHFQDFKIPAEHKERIALLNTINSRLALQSKLCETIKQLQEGAAMEVAEDQAALQVELCELEQECQQLLSEHYPVLHCFCLRGQARSLERYLAEHPVVDEINHINRDGLSALHIACLRGDTKTAKLLIDAGADVMQKDALGYFPIHYLAANVKDKTTFNKMMKLLNNEELLSSLGPYKRSALHAAARYGNETAITVLLKQAQINPRQTNEHDQRTALHIAATQGHIEVVHRLLKHDADLAVQTNKLGETALYEAVHAGHREVAEVFANHECWLGEEESKQLQKHACSNEKIKSALLIAIKTEKQKMLTIFFAQAAENGVYTIEPTTSATPISGRKNSWPN